MSNYEIMLILDPKSDDKIITEIANSSFLTSKEFEIKKLERTELAYEIKKSKTAFYYLVTAKATGDEINEFLRKANIAKNIWRTLSINLDSEKGLNRKAKPKRVRRPFVRRNQNQMARNNNSNQDNLAKDNKNPKTANRKADGNKKASPKAKQPKDAAAKENAKTKKEE